VLQRVAVCCSVLQCRDAALSAGSLVHVVRVCVSTCGHFTRAHVCMFRCVRVKRYVRESNRELDNVCVCICACVCSWEREMQRDCACVCIPGAIFVGFFMSVSARGKESTDTVLGFCALVPKVRNEKKRKGFMFWGDVCVSVCVYAC